MVAAAGPAGVSRDRVIELLWADGDDEHSRHALAQLVYSMRRTLKRPMIAGDTELRLDPESLTSDIGEFVLAATDPERLSELYTGTFLDGFHLSDAPEFSRWADRERDRAAERACLALEVLARKATADGKPSVAVENWRRRVAIGPLDLGPAAGLMEALAAAGDRAAAIRHARLYQMLMRTELELEPDPEIEALAERIRHAPHAVASLPATDATLGHGDTALAMYAAAESRATEADGGLELPSASVAKSRPGTVAAVRNRGARGRTFALGATGIAASIAIAVILWPRLEASIAEGSGDASSTVNVAGSARSGSATRLYDAGLRVLNDGDATSAFRLFDAALAEDSTFPMAAFYAWRAATISSLRQEKEAYERLRRVARRGTERDRLYIEGTIAAGFVDISALAMAETLATRFPGESDGQLLLAAVRSTAGDYAGAAASARFVQRIEAGVAVDAPQCRMCDAFNVEISALIATDSLDAAERVAREWIRVRPRSLAARGRIADVLERAGRFAEAMSVISAADSIVTVPRTSDMRPDIYAIRAGRFAEADQRLRPALKGMPSEAASARWLLLISLRNQGRFEDALRLASDPLSVEMLPPQVLGHALFETGRYSRAVAHFDSLSVLGGTFRSAGLHARVRAWSLAHLATALAGAGDTARLKVDLHALERAGAGSLYSRDRLLHHYARGLLLRSRGDSAGAIGELRKSISSPTEGFTRASLELGRLLIQAGRPAEAAAILAPALRGSIDASNFYVTRTELHELLAVAYSRTDRRDQAAGEYRHVAAAWRNGDPSFRSRGAEAGRRASSLTAGRRESRSGNGNQNAVLTRNDPLINVRPAEAR